MAGGAGDDSVRQSSEALERSGAQKFDSRGMSLDRIAGEDARDFTALGQGYIEHEVVTRHAGDFQQLRMQRVVGNRSFDGQRLPHELGGVDDLDCFLRRQAWSDQLAAAGETKHQVLLDKAEGDVQLGRHEAFVNVDGDAALCFSQPAMLGKRARIVVDDAIPGRDLFAQNGLDFGWGGFAMQPGGDEDGDTFDRDAGIVQTPKQGRKGQPVGSRPGDVANRDGRGLFPGRQGGQWLAADGVVKGPVERRGYIGQSRRGSALNQFVVGPGG